MKQLVSVQLLCNKEQEPTKKLFKTILSRNLYTILLDIESFFSANGLTLEWRYYNDGKAWLGKVSLKKMNKTMKDLRSSFFNPLSNQKT